MNKIKNLGVAIVAPLAGLFALAGHVFAQTPPVADPDVVQAVEDIATGTQTSGVSMIKDILPIAGILLISIIVIFFGIKLFRKVAHV